MVNKKILLDARFYGINHTGIGRYVENLIENLPKSIILLVGQKDVDNPKLSKHPKIISRTHPYSILSQFEVPYLLSKIKPDLVHVPYSSIPVFWPGKMVVTFHDLIKHYSKGIENTTRAKLLYWVKYLGYLAIDYISAKRATAIITPTFYWQKIISEKYRLPISKIHVTNEAVDDSFINLLPKPVSGLKRPFIVHTGNLYPHKNLAVVFRAIQELPINLYLICARSVFEQRAKEQINKLNISNKVFFLGKLSDSEIKYVYKHALALVFPSKIEGFGLNGLEAMSVGLPVISSDASCLPEVNGEAALYFNPDSYQELVKHVVQLIKDKKLRSRLISAGLIQVKKYSWSKTARDTWKVYESV